MEVIRFQCPACSSSLTVPPAAAGFQGPCPKCAVEIIGPDPALDLPASLPEIEASAKAFDPFPDSAPPTATPIPIDPTPELIPPTDPFAGAAPSSEPSNLAWSEPEVAPPSPPELLELPEKVAEDVTEPFNDFIPPIPEFESAAPFIAQPTPGSPRPSVAVFVLSCLLCLVVAFVAGYTLGRRIPEPGSPIFSSKTNESPATKPIPIPVRTWIANATPLKSGEQKIGGPQATLNAFLNADGWASRSAYVMFPESIRARMEARSKVSDDGPIETTSISLFEVTEQAHIFQVATPKLPEGFPVTVARDNNSWLIDWESFIEFHEDRFQRFAAGEEGDHGVFHLLVKPVESNNKEALFEQFQLNPPMPGRQQTAYIGKGSVVLARIQGIFNRQAGLSEKVFKQLLDGQGPPMVLALSYRTNTEGQSYLQIDDIVSIGWGPGEP